MTFYRLCDSSSAAQVKGLLSPWYPKRGFDTQLTTAKNESMQDKFATKFTLRDFLPDYHELRELRPGEVCVTSLNYPETGMFVVVALHKKLASCLVVELRVNRAASKLLPHGTSWAVYGNALVMKYSSREQGGQTIHKLETMSKETLKGLIQKLKSMSVFIEEEALTVRPTGTVRPQARTVRPSAWASVERASGSKSDTVDDQHAPPPVSEDHTAPQCGTIFQVHMQGRYGLIRPALGGPDVRIVPAVCNSGNLPALGDLVTYNLVVDQDGTSRADAVEVFGSNAGCTNSAPGDAPIASDESQIASVLHTEEASSTDPTAIPPPPPPFPMPTPECAAEEVAASDSTSISASILEDTQQTDDDAVLQPDGSSWQNTKQDESCFSSSDLEDPQQNDDDAVQADGFCRTAVENLREEVKQLKDQMRRQELRHREALRAVIQEAEESKKKLMSTFASDISDAVARAVARQYEERSAALEALAKEKDELQATALASLAGQHTAALQALAGEKDAQREQALQETDARLRSMFELEVEKLRIEKEQEIIDTESQKKRLCLDIKRLEVEKKQLMLSQMSSSGVLGPHKRDCHELSFRLS